MSKDSLLVRMDIGNTQNDLTKVLWFIASDESAAKAWLNEMEFEHIEMANDAGGGMGRGGLRFSESRLIPLKDVSSMRMAEMGQITLGDLFSLFTLMSQHALNPLAEATEAEAAPKSPAKKAAAKAKPAAKPVAKSAKGKARE